MSDVITRRSMAALLFAVPALLAQEAPAGSYKGKWAGRSAGGDFMIRLEQDAGQWKATVKFTFADTEVPSTVSLLQVKGSTVEIKYEFDLAGNKLQSHLLSEVKDGELSGKYTTRPVGDASVIDEGTCSAKRE